IHLERAAQSLCLASFTEQGSAHSKPGDWHGYETYRPLKRSPHMPEHFRSGDIFAIADQKDLTSRRRMINAGSNKVNKIIQRHQTAPVIDRPQRQHPTLLHPEHHPLEITLHARPVRSEEHTSELQSREKLVWRRLLRR